MERKGKAIKKRRIDFRRGGQDRKVGLKPRSDIRRGRGGGRAVLLRLLRSFGTGA